MTPSTIGSDAFAPELPGADRAAGGNGPELTPGVAEAAPGDRRRDRLQPGATPTAVAALATARDSSRSPAVATLEPAPNGPTNGPAAAPESYQGRSGGRCTAPQLRRFIKSRAWVPMHELRRRFAIDGAEDEVTPVSVDAGTVFVGLPPHEGQLLGELFRAGDIGYELSVDPTTPVVIGVYPMRPVPRH